MGYYVRSLSNRKSVPRWKLQFISQKKEFTKGSQAVAPGMILARLDAGGRLRERRGFLRSGQPDNSDDSAFATTGTTLKTSNGCNSSGERITNC